jgi:carbonic anhydrase/acetyltransferase-like protein (isoleucine patch superfamily)
VLRSTTFGVEAVIGDKCVLLEGSVVESQAVVAPGSVVAPGALVGSGQLWAGTPARYVRDLTKDEASLSWTDSLSWRLVSIWSLSWLGFRAHCTLLASVPHAYGW